MLEYKNLRAKEHYAKSVNKKASENMNIPKAKLLETYEGENKIN